MKATILKRKFLSKDIFSLTISLEKPLLAKPGQFILLTLEGYPQRAYSIVEEKDSTIILGIKVEQHVSKKLSEIPEGTKITLLGPFGSFIPREGNAVTLIAGGIGITPLISLYKHYVSLGVAVQVLLSSQGDFVFLDYFDKPTLFDTSVSRRIEPSDVAVDSLVYLCGPPPMITGLRNGLIEKGWDPDTIFSEEFAGDTK